MFLKENYLNNIIPDLKKYYTSRLNFALKIHPNTFHLTEIRYDTPQFFNDSYSLITLLYKVLKIYRCVFLLFRPENHVSAIFQHLTFYIIIYCEVFCQFLILLFGMVPLIIITSCCKQLSWLS